MKQLQIEVLVGASRARACSLLLDPNTLGHRHDNFLRFEILTGIAGLPGVEYEIFVSALNKEISYRETLQSVDLPKSFIVEFQASHGSGTTVNTFVETGPNSTIWKQNIKFEVDAIPFYARPFMPLIMKSTARQEMEKFAQFVTRLQE